MIPTNPELRQFITQFFNDEELETLCFDYFPEALNDFGGGMSKNRKVIALIGHCERRDRLPDLHAALERERAAAWKAQFATGTAAQKPSFLEKTRFLNERDPRQIFLSHATADAEFAHTLAADLRAEGWRVWIAPESIQPGEKWVEAIDRGLETSGVFVVVLTPDAVASRWVNTETDAAVEMQHEGLITFIPLEVTACQPKRVWRQYQHVPFQGGYNLGLDMFLRQLDGDEPNPPARISIRERQPEPLIQKVAPNRRIHEKTGIELIRIPAGLFFYSDANRTIDLPEFWIGRYPVTNAQYARFVQLAHYKTTRERENAILVRTLNKNPKHWYRIKGATWQRPIGSKSTIAGKDDHPVVQVSWDDAKAFCDWAGLVLPTEEQWEKAARGVDGRHWPWGEKWVDGFCNTSGAGVGGTTSVGLYTPQGDSPYGCADMTGNVMEWTSSWYDDARDSRVGRGGSWIDNFLFEAMPTWRAPLWQDHAHHNVGFRVVELLLDPDS